MSTRIIPEISKNKPEWIPKHRYYELKHFCLQYPEWKKMVSELNLIKSGPEIFSQGSSAIAAFKISR